MSGNADGDLVRRAQRGDKRAFGELFTRYEGRIFGYLYRMVGDHRARLTFRDLYGLQVMCGRGTADLQRTERTPVGRDGR